MGKLATMLLLFLLTIPVSLEARQVDESELDSQIREIAKTLRCTVCQTENIWESQSNLAGQMRDVIRTKLQEGDSPEEIMAYFLSRYGDYILMKPQKRGLNWLIWAGPFILLGAGGLFLYRTLSRWTKQSATTPTEELPPLDERERQRIDQELRTFEK